MKRALVAVALVACSEHIACECIPGGPKLQIEMTPTAGARIRSVSVEPAGCADLSRLQCNSALCEISVIGRREGACTAVFSTGAPPYRVTTSWSFVECCKYHAPSESVATVPETATQ